jgi:hypothetical protein
MTTNIVFNSTNVIGQNNNTFQYNFINGAFEVEEGSVLSTENAIIPNSIANFTSYYNNLTFGYVISGSIGMQYGGYVNGGVQQDIYIKITGTQGTSNTFDISSAYSLLYVGYQVAFNGITTPTPLYITAITNNVLGGSTYYSGAMTITLNQTITAPQNTIGYGYYAGNKIVIATLSKTYVPQVNMYISSGAFSTTGGGTNTSKYYGFITNVQPATPGANYNNQYIITLNNSIDPLCRLTQISGVCYTYGYQVSLNNGYYTINDISKAMQNTMFANGHYFYNLLTNSQGVKASGLQNESNFYPLGIDYSIPNYGFSMTGYGIVNLMNTYIEGTFGTGALVNTPTLVNGAFDYVNQVAPSNNWYIVEGVYDWSISVAAGVLMNLNNGTALLPSPTIGSNLNYISSQYTGVNANIPITIDQKNYYGAGTYLISCIVCQSLASSTSSFVFAFNNIPQSLTWTTTQTITTANTWTTKSFSLSIPTGNYATDFAITMNDTLTTNINQYLGITNITITCLTSTNVGNNWKGGYPTQFQGSPIICPNIYQPLTFDYSQNVYVNTNKYCLGNYLASILDYQMNYTASANSWSSIYNYNGLPAYGLGMNPVYGILMRLSIADNPVSNLTDIIDGIPLLYNFGQNNNYVGNPFSMIKLKKGKYNSMQLLLCDQNGVPIILLDPNVLISFVLKKVANKKYANILKNAL